MPSPHQGRGQLWDQLCSYFPTWYAITCISCQPNTYSWQIQLYYFIFSYFKKKLKLYFYSYLKLGLVILESYQILKVGSPQSSVEMFQHTQPTLCALVPSKGFWVQQCCHKTDMGLLQLLLRSCFHMVLSSVLSDPLTSGQSLVRGGTVKTHWGHIWDPIWTTFGILSWATSDYILLAMGTAICPGPYWRSLLN